MPSPSRLLLLIGAARRATGRAVMALTPPPEPLCYFCGYGLPQCECRDEEDYWQEFLDDNPSTYNQIQRLGREAFGWPPLRE